MEAAMMRSGRFGRQITIDYPNEEEREAMIKHYFGKKTLPMGSATIADVVALTANMTPADIKEVANESAILTLRSKKSSIGIDEINEAINKVITKNIRHPDRDSAFVRLVSVHESGHALAEVLWLGTIPVKMTSYSYGDAGGFTQPSSIMKGIVTADRMIREIRTLLGGRAAEKVMFDHVSTGASDDLSKAKRIMRSYYETYMFEPYDKSKLDQIVLDRITLIFDEVVQAFRQNMDELNALSDALCAKRVMYSDDISTITYKAIGRYI
jgi:cell division protease FtsH